MVRFIHDGKVVTIPANESSVHMTSYGNRDGQIQHVSGFEVAVIKVEDEKKARTEDPLGQPSGKYDFKVFYDAPPSSKIPLEYYPVRMGYGCHTYTRTSSVRRADSRS